jgi:hypothetical protein
MNTNIAANVSVTGQETHLAPSEILFSRILVATDFFKTRQPGIEDGYLSLPVVWRETISCPCISSDRVRD